MTPRSLAPVALLLAVTPALASDLEYQSATLEEGESRLETTFDLSTEGWASDNLDYRAYDDASDQAILDSDDRRYFAYNSLYAKVGYDVDDRTEVVVGLSHRGHWGNDALGGSSPYGGWVYISDAYARHAFGDGEGALVLTAGRQYLTLGGAGRDYVLADTLDLVKAELPLVGVGTLTLIPINIVSQASSEVEPQLLMSSEGTPTTFSFRGDLSHKRLGGFFVLDELVDGLDARAYAFYTDVGALGSGSDITYGGTLGNFVDNDWVFNAGARASYEAGPVTPYASFDVSTGIDRRALIHQDVTADGIAFGAGAELDLRDDEGDGLEAEASFFLAQGPTYSKSGLSYSHGYVGMKGKHVGGTLYNRFMGYHPTAYLGTFGVNSQPHDVFRVSGTQVVSLTAEYEIGDFEVGAGWWWLTDTGLSTVDFETVDALDTPDDIQREWVAAQERLGLSLGHEVDLDLSYQLTEHIGLSVGGAVVLPGEFWSIEVARAADGSGTVLGGEEMAWAVGGGTSVSF